MVAPLHLVLFVEQIARGDTPFVPPIDRLAAIHRGIAPVTADLRPDARTFGPILNACAYEMRSTGQNLMTTVNRVLEDMRERKISPSTFCWNQILQCCLCVKDRDTAQTFLSQMKFFDDTTVRLCSYFRPPLDHRHLKQDRYTRR